MSQWNTWLQGSYRQARRVAISVVGFTVLAIGVVLLVTPGPAFLVIPIGLGILAIEFAWARRWLLKIKEKAQDAADRWNGKAKPEKQSTASPVENDCNPHAEDLPTKPCSTPESDLHSAQKNF